MNDNPYSSPAPQSPVAPNSSVQPTRSGVTLRIISRSHTIQFAILVVGIFPLFTAACCFVAVSQAIHGELAGVNAILAIAAAIGCALFNLLLLHRALDVSVLWIELGEQITGRTILRQRTYAWHDVARIYLREGFGGGGITSSFNSLVGRSLIVKFKNGGRFHVKLDFVTEVKIRKLIGDYAPARIF